MAHLTVYKASAGSGKTYTLAFEYLLHLIRNPYAYRRILAVTFTNKATAEMKSRIVNELFHLAKGNPSHYLEPLVKRSRIPPDDVQKNAQQAFTLILHDFSRFSVETIDSFFHHVLKSFTREIGLQSGFNLEMDVKKILTESVDEMLFRLSDNDPLKEWLVHFAEAKIEDGKSWNFKQDILDIGEEIFREKFKLFSKPLIEKLGNKQLLDKYLDDLNKIIHQFETTLQDFGRRGLELIARYDLCIEDFKYGKGGFANHFRKLAEKKDFNPGVRARNACNTLSFWYTKNSEKKESIGSVYEAGLNQLLCDSLHFYDTRSEDYQTAITISRFIYTLGILTDLTKQVREYCLEKNLFLISDVAALLKEIIEGNDAPFIYEKTGTLFNHFMIDEFQDTSWIQWQNFHPLLANSLAENHDCMVVGDVKQSIYRWRNSDWKILSEQLNKDFQAPLISTLPLKANWRSRENIVHFNSLFFKEAALSLENRFLSSLDERASGEERIKNFSGKITRAYEDTYQEIPDKENKSGGFIWLKLFDKEEKDWKEQVKTELPSLVDNLLDRGYNPGDICILVRNNKDGKDIVTSLLLQKSMRADPANHQYEVLSNESLFLETSSAVSLIVSILRYLHTPDDRINGAFMLSEYNRYFNPNSPSDLGFLESISKEPDSLHKLIEDSFPQGFVNDVPVLPYLPLYEMIERIIRNFTLHQVDSEVPFIQAFLDVVVEFSRNETSDLPSFLEWWKKEGPKKTISVSDQQNAIRVLTIHKAKGLEFPVVIIPYCDWTLDHIPGKQNIIWCEPAGKPFDALELVPVNYSSKLAGTIFHDDYYSEKLHAYVDNLNLLYVAFTRPVDKLYVFSPADKEGDMKQVGDLIYHVIHSMVVKNDPGEMESSPFGKPVSWNEQTLQLSIGADPVAGKEWERPNNIITMRTNRPADTPANRLLLNLHKSDYFIMEDDAKTTRINHGNLMHELFEHMITGDDLEYAVNRLLIKGKISAGLANEMKKEASEMLSDPLAQNWFNRKWEVKTEADILLKNRKVRRPDRVMLKDKNAIVVDYKFGEVEEESYKSQIRQYMKYLMEMGYTSVRGYIWYGSLKKQIEVFL